AAGAEAAKPEEPPPGARAVLASGPDGDRARLKTRPHPPTALRATASGTHKLGLGPGGGRDGLVFLPSTYDPRRPTPLMILLHGARGDGERILQHFRDRAEEHGVIIVVPESRGFTWDLVIDHSFGADVGFIDRAIEMAFDRWNIDVAHVALAGFS